MREDRLPLAVQLENIERKNETLASRCAELEAQLADAKNSPPPAVWSFSRELEKKIEKIAEQRAEDCPASTLDTSDDDAMVSWVSEYARRVYSGVRELVSEEHPGHSGTHLPDDRRTQLLDSMQRAMRLHPLLDRDGPDFSERASAELTRGIALSQGCIVAGCDKTGCEVESAIRSIDQERATVIKLEYLFGRNQPPLATGSYVLEVIAATAALGPGSPTSGDVSRLQSETGASEPELVGGVRDGGLQYSGGPRKAHSAQSRTSAESRTLENEIVAKNLRDLKECAAFSFEKLAEEMDFLSTKQPRRQLSGKHGHQSATLMSYARMFSRVLGKDIRLEHLKRSYPEGIQRAMGISGAFRK